MLAYNTIRRVGFIKIIEYSLIHIIDFCFVRTSVLEAKFKAFCGEEVAS